MSISIGQRAGPDELRGDIAQSGVGSLRGVDEDRERLVLGDLVPLHQDAAGLLDACARRHDGAQETETGGFRSLS
jgi:hypothetical protein